MASHSPDPRVLMLIPSIAQRVLSDEVDSDLHPRADYHALQEELGADILDYAALEAEAGPALVRLARRAGRDFALAALGYSHRREYDAIFCNAESVGIPLAFLLKGRRHRPGHVVIGHRLSARKKRTLLRALHGNMDAIFIYATAQLDYAREGLGIPEHKLHLIPFHADHRFYRPMPRPSDAQERMVCSVGLEGRDYPTLIKAVEGTDIQLRLAAGSPWSKRRCELEGRELPPNVRVDRYEYTGLRNLYRDAQCVVTPLYETDFQAGITTILEGMAMGKAVIASQTRGQTDAIEDGVNGIYVPPADSAAFRKAIVDLLENPGRAEALGRRARADLEQRMTLDNWVERIATVVRQAAKRHMPDAVV